MLSTVNKIPGGKELLDAKKILEKVGIKEGMKVADLGCGRKGHFTFQAAKLIGPSGIVYAVDILKSVLENVKSTARLYGIDNIKTIWADLEVLGSSKIRSKSVDLVMLNNIFFQTKKDEIIFNEATRILGNNGKLLVTIWKKKGAPFGPSDEIKTTPDEVKAYAQNAGLEFEKQFAPGPYHISLVFKKL